MGMVKVGVQVMDEMVLMMILVLMNAAPRPSRSARAKAAAVAKQRDTKSANRLLKFTQRVPSSRSDGGNGVPSMIDLYDEELQISCGEETVLELLQ